MSQYKVYMCHVSSCESEVASLKAAQIFGQEEDCLHSLRTNPKQSAHNYVLNADCNQSYNGLMYHSDVCRLEEILY